MTLEQAPNENIIRKLQNLLALAERKEGNEAEAEAAYGLAQQLMARYNLDMQTVSGTVVAGGTAKEKREETPMVVHSAMYQWQRDLWSTIAESNFCAHWVREMTVPHKRKKKNVTAKRHVLLGKETNVLAAQLLGAYLCDTIERLLPYPNSERHSVSANSWRQGCAERLCQRIKTRFLKMQQDDAAHDAPGHVAQPGSAIVMASVFEAERAANYDARYGEGQWAKKLQRDAEWEAGYEERVKRMEAATKKAEEERKLMLANETPAQKKKREQAEAREEAANARWNERYWDKEYKRQSKIDHEAVRAGRSAAENIGLDKQVGAGKTTGRLN